MPTPPPPEGFSVFEDNGFSFANGPLLRRVRDGIAEVGFWVEPRHCNPSGNCHGGWLSTFADVQLASAIWFGIDLANVRRKEGPLIATINLSSDFLAPAPCGSWVVGSAQMLRASPRMAFAQMTATADGTPCLRANGLFKI